VTMHKFQLLVSTRLPMAIDELRELIDDQLRECKDISSVYVKTIVDKPGHNDEGE